MTAPPIEALRLTRANARDYFKGIGEPLIELPTDAIFVRHAPDGSVILTIRSDRFIETAESWASSSFPPAPTLTNGERK